jgi:hypothetical protein
MHKPASMSRLSILTLMLAMGALLGSTRGAFADSTVKVTSLGALDENDSAAWTQLGANATSLSSNFNATSSGGVAIAGSLAGDGSMVSAVCDASPCSWSSTDVAGFAAGECVIWTSDNANGGNGPITFTFGQSVKAAGALIQADGPAQFTAQVQAFNGKTSLGTFTNTSDSNGDAVFLGALDNTAAHITSVTYSLTSCTGVCSDFAIDTLFLNTSGGGGGGGTTSMLGVPAQVSFGNVDASSSGKAHKVSIANKGTASANVGSVSVPAGFMIVSGTDLCSNEVVAPKKSCTIMLQFSPNAPGPFSGSVSAPFNGGTATVGVSGNGTAVALKVPAMEKFAPVAAGATGSPKAVTIANLSKTASVVLSTVTVGAPFMTASDACSNATLGPKGKCVLSVEFAPPGGSKTGSVEGSLNFGYTFGSNNGPSEAVPLSGTVK